MRGIPAALLAKLNERWQADATASRPELSLIVTQASVNTLLSETIHNSIPAAPGDVTVHFKVGASAPDLAYAICIDNGVAKIYTRRLPAEYEESWVYLWTLGPATDVAIEFNGAWQFSGGRTYYTLVTEETPWIFWIDVSGVLWAQLWQDADTRVQLDTGVESISACRAWQSIIDGSKDQGLIAAYIKSGQAWYRAYCVSPVGGAAWEAAQQINDLGSSCSSLEVFRTNDYRVGFIAETPDGIQYVLSERQYTSGSFRPEYFAVWTQQVALDLVPVVQHPTATAEHYTAKTVLALARLFDTPAPAVSVVSVTRTGARTVDLTLNDSLIADPVVTDVSAFLTVSPAQGIAAAAISGGVLHITLAADTPHTTQLTFTVSCPYASYRTENKTYMLEGTFVAPAEIATHPAAAAEAFTVQEMAVSAAIVPIVYRYPVSSESFALQGQRISVALIQTGIHEI